MSDKRKRITINLTPTPAERWAQERRSQAMREQAIERMLKDAADG